MPQALSLARQIADGMAAAHDAGVIHRDLKPENVIVNRDGQALIMDFGIAHSSAAGAAGGGAMTGTIAYMAPEQATGKPVDARADIYAFGLIVYDMLVGRQRLKAHASPLDEMRARFVAPPTPARHDSAGSPRGIRRAGHQGGATGSGGALRGLRRAWRRVRCAGRRRQR